MQILCFFLFLFKGSSKCGFSTLLSCSGFIICSLIASYILIWTNKDDNDDDCLFHYKRIDESHESTNKIAIGSWRNVIRPVKWFCHKTRDNQIYINDRLHKWWHKNEPTWIFQLSKYVIRLFYSVPQNHLGWLNLPHLPVYFERKRLPQLVWFVWFWHTSCAFSRTHSVNFIIVNCVK